MKFLAWLMVVAMLAWMPVQVFAEDKVESVTVDKMNNFPEKYDGKTIQIDEAQLSGRLRKHEKVFIPTIFQGKSLTGLVLPEKDKMTPIIGQKIAEKMTDELDTGLNYLTRITMKVEKDKDGAYLANIKKVEFYSKGKIAKTYEEK